jgi:uncharacterized membrane protein YfcA
MPPAEQAPVTRVVERDAMPPELVRELPLLIIITLLASLLQGAVGFGFGLLAVAGLSLLVELKVSTPLLALLNLPVILVLFWRLRREVVWAGLAPIIAGMLIGIPFGIFVLVTWPQALLLRILGVVLIISGIRSAIPQGGNGDGREEQRSWWGLTVAFVVGLSTGALAGAFNTGGPPLIAYVYCRPGTKEQRTATLQTMFAISVVARIIVMAAPPASLYDRSVVLAALICLPGALIGSFAGQAIFRRVPQRGLEVFVSLFLLVVGLKALIWP